MKRVYILVIVTLVIFIGLGINSSRAFVWEIDDQTYAYRSDNLLRLHILANSSSPEDQFLKRQIRDLIVGETSGLFQEVSSMDQAMEVTNTHLLSLQSKVEEYLHSQGKKLNVHMDLGDFNFPTRTYGNLTLPAGEYQALRVVLGEGDGNNWWCVLFPPLCLDNEEENLVDQEESMMTFVLSQNPDELEIEYRLKFLEGLEEVPQWVKANYMNVLRLALMGSNGVVLPHDEE